MKRYGLLIILILFSSSAYAANCIPKVSGKKVTVEYYDGKGKLVHSELHKITSNEKYKGLVSNGKALEEITTDRSGKVKVKSGKLDLASGGMITRVATKKKGLLASIGGCPISKLKFYSRIGKERSPFVHKSIIQSLSKVKVTQMSDTTPESPVTSDSSSRSSKRMDKIKNSASNNSKNTAVEANRPTKKTRSSSELISNKSRSDSRGKGSSKALNDVYGWYGTGSYYLETIGSGDANTLGTITISPDSTFSLSGENAFCMFVHFDEGMQMKPGQTTKDIKSKLIREEMKNIKSLENQFVKFNNLRLIRANKRTPTKGQSCLFSSISRADLPAKTNASFTLDKNASSAFLNLNVAGNPSGRFFLPGGITHNPFEPEASGLKFQSTNLDCRSGFSWSSSKHHKAITKRMKRGEFDNIDGASIELVGVTQSGSQKLLCEIDSIDVKKLN